MSPELLVALVQSKAFTTLVVLVCLWQLKVLVQAVPAVTRALDRRRATREALRAKTKAERDHACEVLRILHGEGNGDPPPELG
ncbi:hypothetical protein GCM10010492_41450 [Saccharothrix mutabilis subsp. mutabilis]|uniref:Uncharacterized protein n=1 Tax=Saccharothrix mutabilis subsp. mutabilis TaxID=66855 RepID=A0ABN0U4S0_9PSEU